MTLRLTALLSTTALLVAAPALGQPSCPQFFAGGLPPRLVKASLGSRTTMLCNDAYASLASGVTHVALWSAEHPTAASIAAASDTVREGDFHPDDRIPFADQAQLADYRRSGYDRGHMTPSGDMPDETAQEQSFSLANIVPQTPRLNRGVWERIEAATRALASRDGEAYVVTGAVFAGQQLQSIGPDGVLVPTSTWKAVYDPLQGAAAYVCQNTATPTCATMSVAALTTEVGIDPFPALSARVKDVAVALLHPAQRRTRRKRQTLFDWVSGQ